MWVGFILKEKNFKEITYFQNTYWRKLLEFIKPVQFAIGLFKYKIDIKNSRIIDLQLLINKA